MTDKTKDTLAFITLGLVVIGVIIVLFWGVIKAG